MYIIIIGGGRVGYYLAKALLDEGHEILILEKNTTVCDTVNDELGSICYRGDGCEAATLAQVGTGRADMLVAVTGEDEDNLVSCQVAKHKFKVPRTIARIRNPRNEVLFKKLGIDVYKDTEIVIQNIVAISDLGGELNLNEVAMALGLENVEYEPEQFPGLVYRIKEPRVAMLLFGSGKIVCTGARKVTDVSLAVDKLSVELTSLGLIHKKNLKK